MKMIHHITWGLVICLIFVIYHIWVIRPIEKVIISAGEFALVSASAIRRVDEVNVIQTDTDKHNFEIIKMFGEDIKLLQSKIALMKNK